MGSGLYPAPNVSIAPNLDALSEAGAEFWAHCAGQAIAQNGRFVAALAGGSTPRGLYLLLGTPAWRSRVDWSRTHVFWGDERMVPPNDPNSNYLLAQDTLLAHVPIRSGQVHRIPTEVGDPAAVAATYEAGLRDFFDLAAHEWPHFDLVLLGLGPDGHVASLFPGSPTLDETERLVVASSPGHVLPAIDRVTLTLPVLNAARAVAFLVSGSGKASVLRRTLAGKPDLPAARVNPAGGVLRWFVDEAAAGRE